MIQCFKTQNNNNILHSFSKRQIKRIVPEKDIVDSNFFHFKLMIMYNLQGLQGGADIVNNRYH